MPNEPHMTSGAYAALSQEAKHAVDRVLLNRVLADAQRTEANPAAATEQQRATKLLIETVTDGETRTGNRRLSALGEAYLEQERERLAGATSGKPYPAHGGPIADPMENTRLIDAMLAVDGDQHAPNHGVPSQAAPAKVGR